MLNKIGDGVTKFNKAIFTGAAWLIYPLVFVIIYEVIKRYFLASPTNWVYDMTWIIFGAFTFLGGAYTLAEGGHVKADIILNLLPPKGKAILTTVCYLVFFFPMMITLLNSGIKYVQNSYAMKEISAYTSWGPMMWPSKLIMIISFAILLAQGVVEFIRAMAPLFQSNGGEK